MIVKRIVIIKPIFLVFSNEENLLRKHILMSLSIVIAMYSHEAMLVAIRDAAGKNRQLAFVHNKASLLNESVKYMIKLIKITKLLFIEIIML